jgi:hypothetical protein
MSLEQRPTRHLTDDELVWFEIDPSMFIDREAADDQEPGLFDRLAKIRSGAWRCDSYLVLRGAPRKVEETRVVENGVDEWGIDVDVAGEPLGIEFLSRLPCRSG